MAKLHPALEGLTLAPEDGTLGPPPGSISASGTHYRLDGPEDGALTVLISGLGNFMYQWDRFAPQLAAAGRRVLRYDQFGKGWSEAPAGYCYDAEAHDAQLHTLLVELGLAERELTLIAHSMGGIIGAMYATLHPAHVRRLVLLAPAGAMAPPVPLFRTIQALLRFSPNLLMPRLAKATEPPEPPPGDYVGPDAHLIHSEFDARWIRASRAVNGNYCFVASLARMPFTTLEAHLRSVSAPPPSESLRVLLLRGEGDHIVRRIDTDFWRERAFPSAAEVIVPPPLPGGHGFYLEYPAASAAILEFLGAA